MDNLEMLENLERVDPDLMTYEKIMQRCMDRIDDTLDKREGSVLFNALAPACAELAIMYITLNYMMDRAFPDTATGNDLTKLAMERSIFRYPPTKAIRKGKFIDINGLPMDVPIGSRYSGNDLNYIVTERIEKGYYRLECETPGTVGNRYNGVLYPIDYIPNLGNAGLQDILIEGEDEETDEKLRRRYMESLHRQPFGGNIADYKTKVEKLGGVGACKVYPIWNGGGTVKIVIISSEYKIPLPDTVRAVQEAIDPEPIHGQGLGLAPIGHTVTVEGVTEKVIHISFKLTLEEDTDYENLKPYIQKAINDYFEDLCRDWANEKKIVIRKSQIEVKILDLKGIIDIQDILINEKSENLILEENEIPVLGGIKNE